MRKPTKVILHCAATPDSVESKFTAKDVDKWHKARGWKGIGYHWYIRRDGKIERGRKEGTTGAHTRGHNSAIGVCYEGSHFPSIQQWMAISRLYKGIHERHKITRDKWHGHNEFANKDCPGFNADHLRTFLGTFKL